MFRSAAIQTLQRAQQLNTQQTTSIRTLVTAAQKRALNNEQIAGKGTTKASAGSVKSSTPSSTSSTGSTGATPPPSGGGGGTSSSPLLPVIGGISVASGIAYYMDLIPTGEKSSKEEVKEPSPTTTVPVREKVADTVIESKEEEPAVPVVESKKVEKKKTKKKKAVASGNRVINISAPSTDGRQSEHVAVVEHDPSGNRVSVAKFSETYGGGTASSSTGAKTEETTSVAATEGKIVSSLTSIKAAEEELTSVTSSKIDDALTQAHVTMRATLDESFLKDLDKLTENELRIRIAQLATEMGERTKWEAVRLREFLSMKEKEVADK